MEKTLNQFYIILVIGLLAIHANSQCPTFYTDIDLQGDTFDLCSSGNVPLEYNDQASSFTVPWGYSITLYQDINYRGQSFGPYSQGTYNVPGEFNDRLSSVRISRGRQDDQDNQDEQDDQDGQYHHRHHGQNGQNNQDRNCPTFYVDIDQQGDSFQLCSGGNVPGQFNDQVSSFYVPRGYIVRLYRDSGSNGQSYGPYSQGYYNVPGDFNDQLSSVFVRRR